MHIRLILVATVALLFAAAPAQAAFPGTNGKIAYYFHNSGGGPTELKTINPDGSGDTTLIPSVPDAAPDAVAWSPDGRRIAFAWSFRLEVIDQDGSGRRLVTGTDFFVEGVTWSPDGTKLAWGEDECIPPGCQHTYQEVLTVDAATGANQVSLASDATAPAWSPDGSRILFKRTWTDYSTQDAQFWRMDPSGGSQASVGGLLGHAPDWSPDGTKITYSKPTVTPTGQVRRIYVANADGSGEQAITSPPEGRSDDSPAWSPDGHKIAFTRAGHIHIMNNDGSGVQDITPAQTTGGPTSLSWQPIPLNYVRPRGATPFFAHLVPAYAPCGAPNRTHGSPLAFPSCNPPQESSSFVTLGTPDANGRPAGTVGSVRYRAKAGDPSTPANDADVRIDVLITGVLNRSDLTPYSGELAADLRLQITDKNNTPNPGGPGPGTGQLASLPVAVPCASSTCSVATQANAVMPGAVIEGRHAVWELQQAQIYDGGPDGVASTAGGNTLFMTQGLFIP
jgi:hypothetical protein